VLICRNNIPLIPSSINRERIYTFKRRESYKKKSLDIQLSCIDDSFDGELSRGLEFLAGTSKAFIQMTFWQAENTP